MGENNMAVLVLNSNYKNQRYKNLKGVVRDGYLMEKMLDNYKINKYENKDLRFVLDDLKEKLKDNTIKRLHFHYSGHGIWNEEREKAQPGLCLIGTGQDSLFFSVAELKQELSGLNAESIILTLDCCRSTNPRYPRGVEGMANNVATDAATKMFVLFATLEYRGADDDASFTKELSNVTNKGEAPIDIDNIANKVNDSWYARGSSQLCQDDYVKLGNNWKGFLWPVGSREVEEREDVVSTIIPSKLEKKVDATNQLLKSLQTDVQKKTDATNQLVKSLQTDVQSVQKELNEMKQRQLNTSTGDSEHKGGKRKRDNSGDDTKMKKV